MKKAFSLLALIATVGFVACQQPKPDPVAASINASDVTVEEGATVQVNATTNSTAAIQYVVDDSGVYTVNNSGVVTGVKAGTGNLLLKVAAVEDQFTAAEKTIKVTVTAKEPEGAAITIDGDFADWSALAAGTFKRAESDPDAPWEGVKEIRCYADAENVFYYIKFDKESLEDAFGMEPNDMHLRLCINTDGEFESGYANYFLDAYDFIVEGTFAEGGAFVEFDGTLHQRIGSWVSLLEPENGLVYGKGAGVEYEISLNKAKFNEAAATSTAPMPMGDDFETGIRFYYNGWAEFSNMPNSSVEEEEGNGYGYLLRIKSNK